MPIDGIYGEKKKFGAKIVFRHQQILRIAMLFVYTQYDSRKTIAHALRGRIELFSRDDFQSLDAPEEIPCGSHSALTENFATASAVQSRNVCAAWNHY